VFIRDSSLRCYRSLQNQPVRVESKPATLRRFVHIRGFSSSSELLAPPFPVGTMD
jgi:hypothetical protein